MTTEPVFEYDASVVGVEVEVGSAEITRERIEAYCRALGETNPLYTDEQAAKAGPHGVLVAPPSLVFSLQFREQAPDPQVQFGNATFASGNHVELFEPARLGDTITARQQVKEVYAKTGRTGTMVFVVRRTEYTNQHGRPVATAEQAQVHRQV